MDVKRQQRDRSSHSYPTRPADAMCIRKTVAALAAGVVAPAVRTQFGIAAENRRLDSSMPTVSCSNANNRLPCPPFCRVECGDGIIKRRDIADVRPKASVTYPLYEIDHALSVLSPLGNPILVFQRYRLHIRGDHSREHCEHRNRWICLITCSSWKIPSQPSAVSVQAESISSRLIQTDRKPASENKIKIRPG